MKAKGEGTIGTKTRKRRKVFNASDPGIFNAEGAKH
jgi:hypothetical protein